MNYKEVRMEDNYSVTKCVNIAIGPSRAENTEELIVHSDMRLWGASRKWWGEGCQDGGDMLMGTS